MKKGQTYTGKVTEVKFPNKGIVTCEDGEAVVKNVIPGQTIEFAAGRKKSGMCEGRLLSVVAPSELENSKECCPHFGECGGCAYQSMSYENQLNLKEKQVLDLLKGIKDDYEFLGIVGSPRASEYRNKMEFTFGDEVMGGELSLGMHKRGSFYDILNVPHCQIIDSDYRAILNSTIDFFKNEGLCFYHKLKHTGFLRHLLVRKGINTGEIMVDVVTTTQLDYNFDRYRDMLIGLSLSGKIVSILHTKNDTLSDTVQNDGTEILFGRDYIYDELLGLRFKITAFSFFQTNTLGAEVLYSIARKFVMESYYNGDTTEMRGATLFDLYSGTGTIAQMMAAVCGHVYGVEIVPEAVEAAKENARLNGIDNCTFIAGDVLNMLDEIEDRPDYIILDPPRDGIHPKAIQKIINYGVQNMVYISCKPTSLVRDLEIFIAHGYKVVKVCLVDMFPSTANVETVALLSRETSRPAKDYVKLGIDAEEYYAIKKCE